MVGSKRGDAHHRALLQGTPACRSCCRLGLFEATGDVTAGIGHVTATHERLYIRQVAINYVDSVIK